MTQDSWNPNQYDKFKAERSQPFYDLMNLLELDGHPNVIDLGCGTGELTSELHRYVRAHETVGLDSSDEMLKKAQSLSEPGLSFKKGDIQTWQADNEYDIVFSNAALQWVQDHPSLFARLKKSIKPGGQIAIQMPMNHDYPTHTLAIQMSQEKPWIDLLKGETYNKHQTMLSAEEYATLMFKLGFKEQKVFLRVYGHILDNRASVIEWVKGSMLTHFQSRLSQADYQAFLAEYTQRLFTILPDSQPFFYPFKRIFIWARL
jgi:trans-aconitate 2-methyltransferase